jgi:hypothetical protein
MTTGGEELGIKSVKDLKVYNIALLYGLMKNWKVRK